MTRRALLAGTTAVFGLAMLGRSAQSEETFEFSLSEAEWRARLSPQAFAVLREAGTERAGTSPLNDEHRAGLFHCGGCDLAVFSSAHKYESGTGWPSFWQPLPDAVRTRADNSFFSRRTEVHCRRCGGHLGHVFNDGPKPTGKRYCMNGVAMVFRAA
ncbi:MAG: peptide-methionine (R)-S-oxide reductase MsrB [Pseudorhodobacter sp.]|nr:peptide-methionine (R)-S-oxide reductase MsrB [Pseudorhodobacter sp.]